jgi:hypothetical protein
VKQELDTAGSFRNQYLTDFLTQNSDKAWFNLSDYMGSQNNGYWSTENPYAAHEVPTHDLKVGVWCGISA